jgi:RNA polymerase sigma-70 factor (ECF subfamily)
LYDYTGILPVLKDEKTIWLQCLNKDPKAEFALYNLYKVPMMGICRRYAKDREHANEMFQEGFIRVFEALHTFKGQSALKTWISKIFIYTAIDYLRKEKKYSGKVSLDVVFNQVAAEEPEDADLLSKDPFDYEPEAVLACMNTLPENYKLVLNLFAIDGLSHAQISEATGISESHSRVILTRARKMLVANLIKKNNKLHVAKHR